MKVTKELLQISLEEAENSVAAAKNLIASNALSQALYIVEQAQKQLKLVQLSLELTA